MWRSSGTPGTPRLVDRHRAGRPVDPGDREPRGPAEHRLVPDPDDRHQVRPVAVHRDRRPAVRQVRQLRLVQCQRRFVAERDQRLRGHRTVQLSGHRDRIGRGRPGAEPGTQRRPRDGVRDACLRLRLHPWHRGGVRHGRPRDSSSARPLPSPTRPTRSSAAPGPERRWLSPRSSAASARWSGGR